MNVNTIIHNFAVVPGSGNTEGMAEWRQSCCNPFNKVHHTVRKKSQLRAVTKQMCKKVPSMLPGEKICRKQVSGMSEPTESEKSQSRSFTIRAKDRILKVCRTAPKALCFGRCKWHPFRLRMHYTSECETDDAKYQGTHYIQWYIPSSIPTLYLLYLVAI